MRYNLDLTRISLDDYRELLKQRNLLPSRRLLLDHLDSRFDALQAQGLATLSDLFKALSSSAKTAAFAVKSGVPETYLSVLKREAGTLKSKRIPLQDFPDVDPLLVESLGKQSIATAKDYLESGQGTGGELYCLCDLTRINGVGANAAKLFYEAGYRSPSDIAAADAKTMLARIAADNAAHRYYQGTLGEKDMQFCIDFANLLIRLSQ